MKRELRNLTKRARKVNPLLIKHNINSAKPEPVRVLATVLTGDGIRAVTNSLPASPIATDQLKGSTHLPGFSGPRQEMHSTKGRIETRKGHRKLVKAKVSKYNVPAGFNSQKAYDKYMEKFALNNTPPALTLASYATRRRMTQE